MRAPTLSFIIAFLFAATVPLAYAASSPNDLAAIKAAIMADPRAAGMSADQIDRMAAALAAQAQQQGVTADDILWRPTVAPPPAQHDAVFFFPEILAGAAALVATAFFLRQRKTTLTSSINTPPQRGASVLAAMVFIALVSIAVAGLQSFAPDIAASRTAHIGGAAIDPGTYGGSYIPLRQPTDIAAPVSGSTPAPANTSGGTPLKSSTVPLPPKKPAELTDAPLVGCRAEPGANGQPATKWTCPCDQTETGTAGGTGLVEACLPGCTYKVEPPAKGTTVPKISVESGNNPASSEKRSRAFPLTIKTRNDLKKASTAYDTSCTIKVCGAPTSLAAPQGNTSQTTPAQKCSPLSTHAGYALSPDFIKNLQTQNNDPNIKEAVNAIKNAKTPEQVQQALRKYQSTPNADMGVLAGVLGGQQATSQSTPEQSKNIDTAFDKLSRDSQQADVSAQLNENASQQEQLDSQISTENFLCNQGISSACQQLKQLQAQKDGLAQQQQALQQQSQSLAQQTGDRAGSGCLNSAQLELSGFLPGYAACGALRF